MPTRHFRFDYGHAPYRVVANSRTWEQKLAEMQEDMPEVARYVTNQDHGFTIPNTVNDEPTNYLPDRFAAIHGRDDEEDVPSLDIKVSREKKGKETNVRTA